MTTECSNNLTYNKSNNIYTLQTAQHCYKTRCGQTERQTDRQIDRQTDMNNRSTDRHTDISTYRGAIAAKNIGHIECHNTHKLITALQLLQNLLPTDILTFRAAIAAQIAKYNNRMF